MIVIYNQDGTVNSAYETPADALEKIRMFAEDAGLKAVDVPYAEYLAIMTAEADNAAENEYNSSGKKHDKQEARTASYS